MNPQHCTRTKEKLEDIAAVILVGSLVIGALVGLLAFTSYVTSATIPTYKGILSNDILTRDQYTFYLRNVTLLFSGLSRDITAYKAEQIVTCGLSATVPLFWFISIPTVTTSAKFNASLLTIGSQVTIQRDCSIIEESQS